MERSAEEIARLTGGRLVGDGAIRVRDVAPLEDAGPGHVAFTGGRRPARDLQGTAASVVLVPDTDQMRAADPGRERALVLVPDPRLAFAGLIELFRPAPTPAPGVHPSAVVARGVTLGEGVSIGPLAVLEEGVEVGAGASIHAQVFVGRGARIGEGTVLYPGVVVGWGCVLGRGVVVHANAVIGSDGFGYAPQGGRYVKIPQRGIVRIGDDVEIGASTTIDRATLGETVIGRGTKIDNLVQVAHNVSIGEDVVMAAQTGIAGSTTVGDSCTLAGQVGLVGHIRIGPGTMIGAKSGVSRDLPGGAPYSGIPALEHARWLKAQALYARLPEMKKRLQEIERRLKELERRSKST